MGSFNRKLGAMILILVRGHEVNRTALNKLLFFSDLLHFLGSGGRLISGVSYIKKQYGPVPEGITGTREFLVRRNYLEQNEYNCVHYLEYRYKVKNVDFTKVEKEFTADETASLSAVKHALSRFSATALSEWTHKFEPWKSAYWESVLDFSQARTDAVLGAWLKKNGLV